ncbi:MAG: glycosyltransferase [Alphaproteobacteria bacterium]|nr:glycosyltransferase [Alphaproteobacteria bacterium]
MNIIKKTAENPQVSVLMPVYKTPEKYLQEAIESILNQTFHNFEFLILDDCPEQPVGHIVQSYKDKRIKYSVNPYNMGISATRNKLIDMAQGKYLAIMDHDDIALPERFAKEVCFLDTHPDIGVVGTWYERFPRTKIKKRYIINSQIERDLMYNCSILHPSAMIRKSILVDNNIRYESKFSPAEDYMLWARLIGKTKFANIPEVLQKYRDYAYNTSKTQSAKMKESSKKVHLFLEQKHPQLMSQASTTQTYKICGFPLVKRDKKGCVIKYTYFGLFKTIRHEPIMTYEADNLPIYIINFNRLTYLKQMIAMLEKYKLRNIHIIDNASTYPPMIEYLKHTPHTVHRMPENYGHMVFFHRDEFKNVRENEYYVMTDPDVIAINECPKDFMDYFYQLLQQYPEFNKVGFSLKTDDINCSPEAKALILKWENLFYKHRLNNYTPYLYASAIDTTFAMYRPLKNWIGKNFYKGIRTGAPYEARHLPWYKDLHNLSDEDKFYAQTDCGSGNWNDANNLEKIKICLMSKAVDTWWENIFSIKKSHKRTIMRILGIKFTFNKK